MPSQSSAVGFQQGNSFKEPSGKSKATPGPVGQAPRPSRGGNTPEPSNGGADAPVCIAESYNPLPSLTLYSLPKPRGKGTGSAQGVR